MRIDLNANVGQTPDAGQTGKAGSRVAPGVGNAAAEGDRTQLSTDAGRVQALSAAVLQLPEIRQDKVAALAEQVQKGSYQVGAVQTAEALLTALTTNRAG
ncbi:MAG TPA: flagellar biosynthesis anti-sigma factor FlgM [Bryobacteraceae bacterium]|nr:flagellar biosynthesis anti-sigma factor FlgM [Bryobacteraceae bacterium]